MQIEKRIHSEQHREHVHQIATKMFLINHQSYAQAATAAEGMIKLIEELSPGSPALEVIGDVATLLHRRANVILGV